MNHPAFRNLRVWQSALDLAEQVYRETGSFPSSEKYGITSQMRRSAVSIVANIAEGRGRNSTRAFAWFIDVSLGSLRELQALIELSTRLRFLPEEAGSRLQERASVLSAQLLNLIRYLRKKLRRTADSRGIEKAED